MRHLEAVAQRVQVCHSHSDNDNGGPALTHIQHQDAAAQHLEAVAQHVEICNSHNDDDHRYADPRTHCI
jgi:hypothetical protein